MNSDVFQRICDRLDLRSVPYDVLRHEPVFTSEEAAQVRGTPLASGAKALICKADDRWAMFVLPADRKLDSRGVRRALQVRSFRFGSRDEVRELTGLAPGSIPPFGSLFGLETICDPALQEQERINFNAGDHGVSISLGFADYVAVEEPELRPISTT